MLSVVVDVRNSRLNMNIETIDAKGLIAVPKLTAKSKPVVNRKTFRYIKDDQRYWYYECNTKGKWQITIK
jgi:hypothetical protein